MARPTDEPEPEPRAWNIWLTLMVISVAFSIVVAVLEYLGVFGDLGIILSLAGLGLAIAFGLSGSSQRTVELVRLDLRGVRRDLGGLGEDLGALREVSLRGFADLNRTVTDLARSAAEVSRGVAEVSRGVGEVNRGVTEVASLLRERLPHP